MIYDKILYLQELWQDLWLEDIDKLTSDSLQVLLLQEKQIEEKTKKANRYYQREMLIECIWKQPKAKIMDKRYLSDWQLELTFRKNWETFIKLYDEDSREYKKNKERENKKQEEENQYNTILDKQEQRLQAA